MKAIFIDRDGVINKDPGGWTEHNYVTDWKDFIFLPGSLDAIKLLNGSGFDIIMVSNQAGVNKGYFTRTRLDQINNNMLRKIEEAGGNIKRVYYCPHKTEDDCDCRKPRTGMFEDAIEKYKIDATRTYMIGDSQVDVEAAKSVGMQAILILSGKSAPEDVKTWNFKPDYVFKNFFEAAKWVVEKDKRKAKRAMKRRKAE